MSVVAVMLLLGALIAAGTWYAVKENARQRERVGSSVDEAASGTGGEFSAELPDDMMQGIYKFEPRGMYGGKTCFKRRFMFNQSGNLCFAAVHMQVPNEHFDTDYVIFGFPVPTRASLHVAAPGWDGNSRSRSEYVPLLQLGIDAPLFVSADDTAIGRDVLQQLTSIMKLAGPNRTIINDIVMANGWVVIVGPPASAMLHSKKDDESLDIFFQTCTRISRTLLQAAV